MEIKTCNLYTRNGTIYIDARVETIGRVRFSTKQKASKENLARVLLEAKSYIYRFLNIESSENKITLADISDKYLSEECGYLKPQTLIKYKSIAKEISTFFANKDVKDITQAQIIAYTKDKQGYKITFLNNLIRFMRDTRDIKLRTIRQKVAIRDSAQEVKPLRLNETQEILKIADENLKDFLIVAIFTGMRTGELLALTLKDCDVENGKIYVSKSRMQNGEIGQTKTKKNRYVDMLDIVKNAILRIKERRNLKSDDYLFTESNKVMRKKWYELLEKAGLEKRALYQTRHTFATLMLTQNEEVLWISAMLGHKSLSTTYTHYVKYIPAKVTRGAFIKNDFAMYL